MCVLNSEIDLYENISYKQKLCRYNKKTKEDFYNLRYYSDCVEYEDRYIMTYELTSDIYFSLNTEFWLNHWDNLEKFLNL